jgi:hypothetical protein
MIGTLQTGPIDEIAETIPVNGAAFARLHELGVFYVIWYAVQQNFRALTGVFDVHPAISCPWRSGDLFYLFY